MQGVLKATTAITAGSSWMKRRYNDRNKRFEDRNKSQMMKKERRQEFVDEYGIEKVNKYKNRSEGMIKMEENHEKREYEKMNTKILELT